MLVRYPRALGAMLLFSACCLFANPASSRAAIILSAQPFGPQGGTGPGLGTVSVPVVSTGTSNNDNVLGGEPSDNNITVPIKRFDNPGFIDIVFNVLPSDGTTEYRVFETVDNNTLLPWTSYSMRLGFGFGGAFVPSTPGDGLDFDAPTFDTPPASSAFASAVPINEDFLFFSGGLQLTGAQSYQFRIDVADLPPGVTQFTLRQTPTPVPEPGTLALLGCGIMGVAFVYRKRR